MASPHYENLDEKPMAKRVDIKPDYMRLYVHSSVLERETEVIPPAPPEVTAGTSTDATDSEAKSDQELALPAGIAEKIEEVKLHTALARQGLELVAAQREGIDVNKEHQVIREDHERRIKKIMKGLRRPRGIK